jgi:hypothetical protein
MGLSTSRSTTAATAPHTRPTPARPNTRREVVAHCRAILHLQRRPVALLPASDRRGEDGGDGLGGAGGSGASGVDSGAGDPAGGGEVGGDVDLKFRSVRSRSRSGSLVGCGSTQAARLPIHIASLASAVELQRQGVGAEESGRPPRLRPVHLVRADTLPAPMRHGGHYGFQRRLAAKGT